MTFKEKINSVCLSCDDHKNVVSGSILVLGVTATGLIGLNIPTGLWIFPVLYGLAIIFPIILGMADKLEFKWVLLWEAVLLLPVAIVVGLGLVMLLTHRS
jgi:hypothetical protein